MSLAITDAHRASWRASPARSPIVTPCSAGPGALPRRPRRGAPRGVEGDGRPRLARSCTCPRPTAGQGSGWPSSSSWSRSWAGRRARARSCPTVWRVAVIAGAGDEALAERWLPGLADGSVVGGGRLRTRIVLGAGLADVLLLADGDDLRGRSTATRSRVAAREQPRPHPSRRRGDRRRRSRCPDSVGAPAAAAGGGPAPWPPPRRPGWPTRATEMAREYAKVREQFGRVIGIVPGGQAPLRQHARRRPSWPPRRRGTRHARRADGEPRGRAGRGRRRRRMALPAFACCAELNIQVHGGIGFTWEHDAHLFLAPGGRPGGAVRSGRRRRRTTSRRLDRRRRATPCHAVELPARGRDLPRRGARRSSTATDALPADRAAGARCSTTATCSPHWPQPWGASGRRRRAARDRRGVRAAGVERPTWASAAGSR